MKNIRSKASLISKVLPLLLAVVVTLAANLNIFSQRPSPSPISVTVTNTGSEPVPVSGTVTVANLGTAPLPVRDIDNPALQPVQAQGFCAVETSGCRLDLYTVPAGKRLVVEYVSMRAVIPTGQVAELEINTVLAGQTGIHLIDMTAPSVNTSGGIPRTSTARMVRLYADAGTKVTFVGLRNSTDGPAGFFYSFSGYLFDLP